MRWGKWPSAFGVWVVVSAVALGGSIDLASCQPAPEAASDFASIALLADRKDYASAIPAISQFMKEQPFSPWHERALYLLAYCTKKAGLLEEALVLYKKAGQEYALLGDYADYNVATLLLDLDAPTGALAEAEAFLQSHPLSRLRTKVTAIKAEALATLGDTMEALRTYESLLSEELDADERPSVLHRYAALLESVEAWARANARYSELYVEHPDYEKDEEIAQSLARIRRQASTTLAPLSSQALYSRARRLMELNLYERAAKTLERVIANGEEPLLTEARYALARCYERTRRRGEAIKLLRLLLDELPNDRRVPDALYRLGKNHWNLDETEQACLAFRTLVAQHPGSPHAAQGLFALGKIALEQGEIELALDMFSGIVRDYPATTAAYESLWQMGWVAYLGGDYEQAASSFRQLERHQGIGPLDIMASYWLGRVEERLGHAEAAAQAYESVRRRVPLSYYALRAGEHLISLRGIKEAGSQYQTISDAPPQPLQASSEDVSLTIDGRYHAARAEELAILHFSEDAKEEIDLLAIGLPADERHQAYLAQLYARSENYRQSLSVWDRLYRSRMHSAESFDRLPSSVLYGLFPLPYLEAVKAHAAKHGLDPLLVESVMRQESAFDHRAISPAGAIGLLQMLPTTAHRVSMAMGGEEVSPEGLFQRGINIALGTQHLADLLHLAEGNVVLALVSYNAGEHKMAEWRARFPTEDMEEFIEQLPYAETRNYVKNVLRNHAVYSALYGGVNKP